MDGDITIVKGKQVDSETVGGFPTKQSSFEVGLYVCKVGVQNTVFLVCFKELFQIP